MSAENQSVSGKKEYDELIARDRKLEMELKNWERKSTRTYEMTLLHKYNEIKDATQVLLGAIANIEGVTVKELHKRFELPTGE